MRKNRGKGFSEGPAPLQRALELLEGLEQAGLAVVPAMPSPTMLEAGARAGSITQAQARTIWQAMLLAANLEQADQSH